MASAPGWKQAQAAFKADAKAGKTTDSDEAWEAFWADYRQKNLPVE